ncbi:MAG: hypothetical protein LBV16_05120 [Elusimicrobiota bacterium]|nr:hypothetical protein [Elusimicrobiota bacterium]
MQYLQGAQKYMRSQEVDENGMPQGAMYKSGDSAVGITNNFGGYDIELTGEVSQGLDDKMTARLLQKITPFRMRAMDSLSVHEAGQIKDGLQKNYESMTAANVDEAARTNGTDNMRALWDSQEQNTLLSANINGISRPEQIDLLVKQDRAKLVKASVDAMLENDDIDGAKEMLDMAKKEIIEDGKTKSIDYAIPKAVYDKLEKDIKDANQIRVFNGIYQESEKFVYSDGGLNLNKAYNIIQNRNDLTDKEKDKAYDFVAAKSGERERRVLAQRQEVNTGFYNDLTKAFNGGVPLEKALPLAKRGYDAHDKYQKELIIRKWYEQGGEGGSGSGGGRSHSESQTYNALYTASVVGDLQQSVIDAEFKKGNLSISDYKFFSKKRTDDAMGIVEASKNEAKPVFNMVTAYVDSTYEDADDREMLKAILLEETHGKSLPEAQAVVENFRDNKVKTGTWLFGLLDEKKNKGIVEVENRKENAALRARAVEDLKNAGYAVTDANINYLIQQYKGQ